MFHFNSVEIKGTPPAIVQQHQATTSQLESERRFIPMLEPAWNPADEEALLRAINAPLQPSPFIERLLNPNEK